MGTPVVTAQGDTVDAATPEDAASLIAQGGHVEAAEERADAATQSGLANNSNPVEAFGQNFASGFTLGGSDAAQRALGGQVAGDYLGNLRVQNPGASTFGQISGVVVPALFGDEAGLAKLTPSGFVSGIGSKIAGLGEGGTLASRALATAGSGAFEGAAQNAGSYISDVALGDRDLSAEGFMGAMGKGAFYGGVAGGALSVASHGLIAARRLFPEIEATPEAVQAAETAAKRGVSDSMETSGRLGRLGQSTVEQNAREADQFIQDLEAERARILQESNVTPAGDPAPGMAAQGEKAALDEAASVRAKPGKMGPEAKELLAKWREKYGGGAVDYDAANAAARRGRLAEWAKDFQPQNEEDAAIKAYFSEPMDPARTAERLGGVDVPPAVKKVANEAAADASHKAYLDAAAQATNVADSGAELMARATYAGRKAAARALDDVYTAYRAGTPIADIRAAATKKLTGELHELASSRKDMIASLAGKDDLLAKLQATKGAVDETGKLPTLGERILAGMQPAADPDAAVSAALGRSKDVNADIAEVAPKITRYEAAKAKVTESLGAKAPPEAQAHAQAFRAAQEKAETASARQTAQAAENIDKTMRGVPEHGVAGGKGILKQAGDGAASYSLLRELGVPLPAIHAIPIVGPLLSLFLKAKLLGKVLGKFGGSFGETAEATIAAKAAQTQNRINASVRQMLGGAAKVTSKAAEAAGAAPLAHKLFDTGRPSPYTSEPKAEPLENMYMARMDELTAAMKPGAIEAAVRARVNTSDPSIVDAMVKQQQAALGFLYQTMPKMAPPSYPGQDPRPPSKSEILNWSPTLAAYHDPAAVFERVAAGGTARPAEVVCIQNCYPNLLTTAQKSSVDHLADSKEPLPYARRVAISKLLGLPMDASMSPARLQSKASIQPPQAAPMPHPTLASNISMGQQTLTRLDR